MKLFYFVGKNSAELAALNESLQNLLDGIQVILTLYSHEFGICCCFCLHVFLIKKVRISFWKEKHVDLWMSFQNSDNVLWPKLANPICVIMIIQSG